MLLARRDRPAAALGLGARPRAARSRLPAHATFTPRATPGQRWPAPTWGHVLVFGLDRHSLELLFIDGLRTIVRAEGAAMVQAHPMRALSSGRRPSWEATTRWFEALEAINGDHGDSEDGYSTRLASELGVAGVAGSDAHSRSAVGRVGTLFPKPVPDVDALVGLLRDGLAAPADLPPPPPGYL